MSICDIVSLKKSYIGQGFGQKLPEFHTFAHNIL